MKRLARPHIVALAAALALVLVAGVAATIAWPRYVASLGPIDLLASREGSTVVVDRDGRLLRPFTLPDGRWRLPATTHDVDPRYLAMLVAYEDGRFYEHRGVDARALLRAAGQWLWRGRVVSGGSTLSMQVARLIEPRPERSLSAKLRQIARALEVERAVGKAGVLDRYLTIAPFGGNLEGVRAASLAYFGKEPHEALDRRSGAARRAAAIAGGAAARPIQRGCARGPGPRARSRRSARDHQRRRHGRRQARAGPAGAQSLPRTCRPCGGGGGRRRQTVEGHPPLDRRAPASEAGGAGQGERRAARRQTVGGDRGHRQSNRRNSRPRRRRRLSRTLRATAPSTCRVRRARRVRR